MSSPREAVVWIWTAERWERHGFGYTSQAELMEDVRQLFVLGHVVLITPDKNLP